MSRGSSQRKGGRLESRSLTLWSNEYVHHVPAAVQHVIMPVQESVMLVGALLAMVFPKGSAFHALVLFAFVMKSLCTMLAQIRKSEQMP